MKKTLLILSIISYSLSIAFSQGTWAPLTHLSPDLNGGVMLLLTDGTVMVKTYSGGSDGIGNVWDKLTPDSHGSYVNGTWTTLAPMFDTRLYFSSQILKDGRVYVAGGEYGSGKAKGEIYDPLTNTWTSAQALPIGDTIYDGNSQMLPDGKILQGVVLSSVGSKANLIFNPTTLAYATTGNSHHSHDEAAWLKLPDYSILFIDFGNTSSERYIPSVGLWLTDATVPDSVYDQYGYESGASFMLPDGRAFFLGSTGHNAYYTPTGNNTPGTWAAGPDFPNGQGTPDAAAAMMVNGKILCATSPFPNSSNTFPTPISFYEFDYLTNSFTQVSAPAGGDTIGSSSCYITNMLDLPDGTVLFADQDDDQYYVYTPTGTQLASGMPTINNITQNGCTFTITGTLFNGISEGAAYGDDWQMATNYPIIRLTNGTNVYYARTSNWNRTGVETGALLDTAQFTLPWNLPVATYSLVVTANGISSAPTTFIFTPCATGITETENFSGISIYPNPANEQTTILFTWKEKGNYKIKLFDVFGRVVKEETGEAIAGSNSYSLSLNGITKGVYLLNLQNGNDNINRKIIIQ